MTEGEFGLEQVSQRAAASGDAVITQVGGDYEEHYHNYVRGWEYLYASDVDETEIDLVRLAYVHERSGFGPTRQVDRAVGLLKDPNRRSNILVVKGAVGTGRWTTALRILLDVGVPGENIHSLVLDWDRPRAQQIPYTPGHGFVLNLSLYGALPKDFYQGLASYSRIAADNPAYLLILAIPGTWSGGGAVYVPSIDHTPSPAIEITRARLDQWAEGRKSWLDEGPKLADLLGAATSPADAVRLARIIADCADDNQEQVKEEFTNWSSLLEEWFGKDEHGNDDKDVRERALIIAVALLDSVPAGIVMKAADLLFEKVGGTLPPGGALAGPDLDKRLEIIGAKRVGEDKISLSKARHGLHEAVLLHVWEQRPLLRDVLLEWASEISAPNGTAVKHLGHVARAITQLAAGPDGRTVLQVVDNWVSMKSAEHRRLAVGVLETMATHPSVGGVVRKYLYDLAKQKNITEELAGIVADVCAEALSRSYPRMALTRLRLLASRDDEIGAAAVARAIRSMASESSLRVLVLAEIIDWAESDDGRVRQAGAMSFLALTDLSGEEPIGLALASELSAASGVAIDDQLFIRGWRAAWAHSPTTRQAQASLAAWLNSPKVPDEQVLDVAAAVLTRRIWEAGAAALLVGSDNITEIGRRRRERLLQRLMPRPALETVETQAVSDTAQSTESAPGIEQEPIVASE